MDKALQFLILFPLQSSISACILALDHGCATNPLAQGHLGISCCNFLPKKKAFLCSMGTVLSINWNNTIRCLNFFSTSLHATKLNRSVSALQFLPSKHTKFALLLCFLKDKDSLGFLFAGGFLNTLALLVGVAALSGTSSNIDNNSALKKSLQSYLSGGWNIKLGLTISSL